MKSDESQLIAVNESQPSCKEVKHGIHNAIDKGFTDIRLDTSDICEFLYQRRRNLIDQCNFPLGPVTI